MMAEVEVRICWRRIICVNHNFGRSSGGPNSLKGENVTKQRQVEFLGVDSRIRTCAGKFVVSAITDKFDSGYYITLQQSRPSEGAEEQKVVVGNPGK